jgi:hypothetical protein
MELFRAFSKYPIWRLIFAFHLNHKRTLPKPNQCKKKIEKILKTLKIMFKNLLLIHHIGLFHHFGLIIQNTILILVAG